MSWYIGDKIRRIKTGVDDGLDEWAAKLLDELNKLERREEPKTILRNIYDLLWKLLDRVHEKAEDIVSPPDRNMEIWIKALAVPESSVPPHIISQMNSIHDLRNTIEHPERGGTTLKSSDSEIALSTLFRILEWFYCEGPMGPGLSSIHNLPTHHPREGRAFRRKLQKLPANGVVGLENWLKALMKWCGDIKRPTLSFTGPLGRGKTTLINWLCHNISRLHDESNVQWEIKWVDCREIASFDDLMIDFAKEMEKRGNSKAFTVRDPLSALHFRLRDLVSFLNATPARWLIVLDDYHIVDQGVESDKWKNFELTLTNEVEQTKLIVIRERTNQPSNIADYLAGKYVEKAFPAMDADTAYNYLELLGLKGDKHQLNEIHKICGGNPLMMYKAHTEAKRTSVVEMLSKWPSGVGDCCKDWMNSLSPAAQTAAQRIAIITNQDYMERDILIAAGATDKELAELDENCLLQRNNHNQLWLDDALAHYLNHSQDVVEDDQARWLGPALERLVRNASLKESMGHKREAAEMVWRFVPLLGGEMPVYMILDWIRHVAKNNDQVNEVERYCKLTVEACILAGEDSNPMSIHPQSLLQLAKLAEDRGADGEAENYYQASLERCERFEKCRASHDEPPEDLVSAIEASQELLAEKMGSAFQPEDPRDWAAANEWEEVYRTKREALKNLSSLCERQGRGDEAAKLRQKAEQMPEDPLS